MTITDTQQPPGDLPDEVVGIFESADGTGRKTVAWRVDDYRQRVDAGQWPLFVTGAKSQLAEALGLDFRQVSATLNGEPLADALV